MIVLGVLLAFWEQCASLFLSTEFVVAPTLLQSQKLHSQPQYLLEQIDRLMINAF